MIKTTLQKTPQMQMQIGNFRMLAPFRVSGKAEFGFCEREGREYFIKRFYAPTYPSEDSGIGEEMIAAKREQGDAFQARQISLYAQVRNSNTAGHIICPFRFFRFGTKYYAVSKKITAAPLTIPQIACEPDGVKTVLLRALTLSMCDLHRNGVVHADIKPDNIMISRTEGGYFIPNVIDFDSSFLLSEPPESWQDVEGDQLYLAPETCLAICDEEVVLTEKVDVFACGLLFHEYWTGRQPSYPNTYAYAHNAVLDGVVPVIDKSVPPHLSALIRRMLQRDPGMRPSMEEVFAALSAECEEESKEEKAERPIEREWNHPTGF